MKIKCIIILGSLAMINSPLKPMMVTQLMVGVPVVRTEEIPYLFGRVLLKLVHGPDNEFADQLLILEKALHSNPQINLDAKNMICNEKGMKISMRSYYKAIKRDGLNRHAFAALSFEQRNDLGKMRFAALEKVFVAAGKPL